MPRDEPAAAAAEPRVEPAPGAAGVVGGCAALVAVGAGDFEGAGRSFFGTDTGRVARSGVWSRFGAGLFARSMAYACGFIELAPEKRSFAAERAHGSIFGFFAVEAAPISWNGPPIAMD